MSITPQDAYITAYLYLEDIYNRDRAQWQGDLVDVLSNMHPLDDGTTADPAYQDEWLNCLPSANPPITLEICLDTLRCFLEDYRSRGESAGKEITRLLDNIDANRADVLMQLQAAYKRVNNNSDIWETLSAGHPMNAVRAQSKLTWKTTES